VDCCFDEQNEIPEQGETSCCGGRAGNKSRGKKNQSVTRSTFPISSPRARAGEVAGLGNLRTSPSSLLISAAADSYTQRRVEGIYTRWHHQWDPLIARLEVNSRSVDYRLDGPAIYFCSRKQTLVNHPLSKRYHR
jgi:hypothetical protein